MGDGDDASTRVQGRRAEERLSARRNERLGGCRKDACCQAYFILEALAFFGALFLSCALCCAQCWVCQRKEGEIAFIDSERPGMANRGIEKCTDSDRG